MQECAIAKIVVGDFVSPAKEIRRRLEFRKQDAIRRLLGKFLQDQTRCEARRDNDTVAA